MQELINKYIDLLKSQGDADEVYKWEAINHFQANWNLDDENFTEMFLNAFGKVGNLLYLNSWGFISTAVTHFPDEVKKMFEELYNEVTPLEERIKSFQKSAKTLLPQVKSAIGKDKLNTQQDERTLSVYLSFRYPEKYYLYKSSFYSKLCAIMGIDTKPPGQRFIHYMDIAEKVKQEYIINNPDLQRLSEDIYPETSWDDSNLFTQNFFYTMLEIETPKLKEHEELQGEKEFLEVIQSHEKQDVLNFFEFLDLIITNFDIQPDDTRVVTGTSNKQLNLTIGQRYCWNLYNSKSKRGKYGLITKLRTSKTSEAYEGKGEQPFYNYFDDYAFALENQHSAIDAIENELNRTKKSSFTEHNNLAYREAIFDMAYRDQILNNSEFNINTPMEIKVRKQGFPLNQILYGPPGTGKTYQLQDKYFDNFTIRESSLSRKQFLLNTIVDKTWWQVLSMAVLDLGNSSVNEIMTHELVQTKMALGDSKLPRNTIWSTLQGHTHMECPNVGVKDRSNVQLFWKDEDSNWKVIENSLEEQYPDAISILESIKNYKPDSAALIKNYEFVTFHQSFSYEDFVEGIKPRMDEEDSELDYEIADGVFKRLALRAKADPDNDYAIFIDEINRGNVSAIFGELITLIEDDKRSDGKNPLSVKLPYSKKEFDVPSNLYIFGAMNTADRSVEALDTALRRRFSFKEIMPKPSLLKNIEFDGFSLNEVLQTINERVEFLLDRDHTIGHSYFMNVKSGDTKALKDVFKNKVIPLLQEYFYHDYEKIALILGSGFVEVKTNHAIKFPTFDGIVEPNNVTLCKLIENIENIEDAITILLNRDAN